MDWNNFNWIKPTLFRHGWFHTWDRWQDCADETQRRECLKCGKSQVRRVATCTHVWFSKVTNTVMDNKDIVGQVYVHYCTECNKHRITEITYRNKVKKISVEIM